jgi:muramoyltetrapeptide carboxypeptidase
VKKKHIYIYSPSGAVRDKAAFRRGVKRLQSLGHDVEVDPDALSSFQRFAGDDATRLSAIHRAAASGADVALISRGGYGLTRILEHIQYNALARAIHSGTAFVGMSDFTALQMALLAKADAPSWAGPALCEGFGVGGKDIPPVPDDIMEDCFNDMLLGQGEGTGWRQDKKVAHDSADDGGASQILRIRGGKIWGGNLTMLTTLLGTPFFPKIDGGILFLEDVGEHPYRIERMFSQLLHAGVFSRQKAIVLGQFTSYKLTSHDKGFKFQSVVRWLGQQVKIPVLTNLPYGHVQTKVLLPVGVSAELLVDGRDALLFWGDNA